MTERDASQETRPAASPRGRTSARRVAFPLIALSASLAVTLGVLEVGARLFSPVGLHPTDTFLAARPAVGGPAAKAGTMALVPNAETRYVTDEFDTRVKISPQGLRDREFPLRKPPGVYRILVLGDSQTFGVGVEGEETYPKVLERRLNAVGSRRVEVINAGVPGTGTAHQLYFLEREGWKYEPDAVVVGLFYNDYGDNQICRLYELRNGRVVPGAVPAAAPAEFREVWANREGTQPAMVVHNPEPPPPKPSLLIRHSHLARLVRERVSRLYQKGRTDRSGHGRARGRALTNALLEEIDRQCAARRARLLVALLPSREQCAGSTYRTLAHPEMPALRSAAGTLDLLGPFRRAGCAPLFFRKDMHYTTAGHRVVGEALARKLQSLEPPLRRRR